MTEERESDAPRGPGMTRGRVISGALVLGAAGLLITVAIWLWRPGPPVDWSEIPSSRVIGLLALLFLAGFSLRALRRKLFFGSAHTLHQAFSFESVFQGISLVNPRLDATSVEREFLRRETGLPEDGVMPWLRLGGVSMVVIPAFLGGVALWLGEMTVAGGVLIAIGVVEVIRRAMGTTWRAQRGRFLAAVVLALAAVAAEAYFFVTVLQLFDPALPVWAALLGFAVLVGVYENSPIPLALGVLEGSWVLVAIASAAPLPHVLLPCGYRLFRALPALLLAGFYLARYKLSWGDAFDPGLASALSKTRRPPGGWIHNDVGDGPLLSVVVPAYNEEQRLPNYLPAIIEFGAEIDDELEIVVVDDGSADGTVAYVTKVAAEHPCVRLVEQGTNQGKGAAVSRGVMEARGRFVLFADADGATPIAEAKRLLPVAQNGAEVVIASRAMEGEGVERERGSLRGLLGSLFYRVTNLLAVPGISDTQCGFEMLHREAARRLFPMLRETGWAFNVELLYLAQKYGMKVAEVAVNWRDVEGSKINPIVDGLKMVVAIWRIRRNRCGLVDGLVEWEPLT